MASRCIFKRCAELFMAKWMFCEEEFLIKLLIHSLTIFINYNIWKKKIKTLTWTWEIKWPLNAVTTVLH